MRASGFSRYEVLPTGEIFSLWERSRRFLRPFSSGDDYLSVCLTADDGYQHTWYIHMLVVRAWLGSPPFDSAHVRHLDRNKLNNHYTNLLWGTALENATDEVLAGTQIRGSRQGAAKLVESDKPEILRRLAAGELAKDIAEDLEVSPATINHIKCGRSWRHA